VLHTLRITKDANIDVLSLSDKLLKRPFTRSKQMAVALPHSRRLISSILALNRLHVKVAESNALNEALHEGITVAVDVDAAVTEHEELSGQRPSMDENGFVYTEDVLADVAVTDAAAMMGTMELS
jgi:hypothetical protein